MPRELLLMEVVQGEGRTRTSDPRATLHGFRIKTAGSGTITEQIKAPPSARKVDAFLFKSLGGLMEQINASIQRGCSN